MQAQERCVLWGDRCRYRSVPQRWVRVQACAGPNDRNPFRWLTCFRDRLRRQVGAVADRGSLLTLVQQALGELQAHYPNVASGRPLSALDVPAGARCLQRRGTCAWRLGRGTPCDPANAAGQWECIHRQLMRALQAVALVQSRSRAPRELWHVLTAADAVLAPVAQPRPKPKPKPAAVAKRAAPKPKPAAAKPKPAAALPKPKPAAVLPKPKPAAAVPKHRPTAHIMVTDTGPFATVTQAAIDSCQPRPQGRREAMAQPLNTSAVDTYVAALAARMPAFVAVAPVVLFETIRRRQPAQYPAFVRRETERMFQWNGVNGHRFPCVVCLPCLNGSHWELFVVVAFGHQPHLVLGLDATSDAGVGTPCRLPNGFDAYLRMALRHTGAPGDPLYVAQNAHSERQTVDNDCGLFVLRNLEWIMRTAMAACPNGFPPVQWLDVRRFIPALPPGGADSLRLRLRAFLRGLTQLPDHSAGTVTAYLRANPPFMT